MIKTKLYELNLGDLPYFDISPEMIPFTKIWDGKKWRPSDTHITTARIAVHLSEMYSAHELDEKHLHITQPKEGELLIVHSPVVGVFNEEDQEWYYEFAWSALWLMNQRLYPWAHHNMQTSPSLQDAIRGLTVDFEDVFTPT